MAPECYQQPVVVAVANAPPTEHRRKLRIKIIVFRWRGLSYQLRTSRKALRIQGLQRRYSAYSFIDEQIIDVLCCGRIPWRCSQRARSVASVIRAGKQSRTRGGSEQVLPVGNRWHLVDVCARRGVFSQQRSRLIIGHPRFGVGDVQRLRQVHFLEQPVPQAAYVRRRDGKPASYFSRR